MRRPEFGVHFGESSGDFGLKVAETSVEFGLEGVETSVEFGFKVGESGRQTSLPPLQQEDERLV
jgi:hypothetical protein